MNNGNDVLRVLGWGLRRYAWLVALFVLGVGVLVPWLLNGAPTQYDAQAQVGPTDTLTFSNLDPLPRLGESVFTNGAVAATIRSSVTPPVPPRVSVIPQRVELVTAQDNVVFVVEGHAPTPQAAARYANLAAAAFTAELNKYSHSVGSFAVQKLATPPALPAPKLGGVVAAAIGVAAGLFAGVGAVVLVLAVRRPVLSPQSALEATGAQGFGRVRMSRYGAAVRGLPHLIRRLRDHPAEVLMVVGPRRSRASRLRLVAELTDILSGLTVVDGPTQAQIATRPDSSLVLLVVPEGIGYAALRRQAEQYLDEGETGVLLVRGRSRRLVPWRHRLLPVRRPGGSPSVQPAGHVERHVRVPARD